MPLRLLIFGSCVSRDILNFDKSQSIELVDYIARSSFASAFSERPVTDTYSNKISSPFQSRLVRADLGKSFPRLTGEVSFDVLLLDFIDERFSLFVFDDGSLCTLSNELRSAGFDQSPDRGRLIRSGTDDFFRLWDEGWRSFVSLAVESGFLERVRVNKVHWATATDDGRNFLPNYPPTFIEGANRFLDRIYTRMSRDLKPEQFLEFRDELIIGASAHRWGISPFHYIDAYYLDALHRLSAIHSDTTGA